VKIITDGISQRNIKIQRSAPDLLQRYPDSIAEFWGDEWKGGERKGGNRKGVKITDGGKGPDQVWGKMDSLPVSVVIL